MGNDICAVSRPRRRSKPATSFAVEARAANCLDLSLLSFFVQFCAILAKRLVARPIHAIVRRNLASRSTFVIVVIVRLVL